MLYWGFIGIDLICTIWLALKTRGICQSKVAVYDDFDDDDDDDDDGDLEVECNKLKMYIVTIRWTIQKTNFKI